MKDYEIIVTGEPVRLVRCGDYIAASDGKIYKFNWDRTGRFKEVKQNLVDRNIGYLRFCFNGKMMRSHRFIAMCFIPNPNNLPQVNHKNEIKTDNRVENLEWCDAKYNINYGNRTKKLAISISKPVLQFTKDGEFVAEYQSATEVERQLGFNQGHISECCRGKLKSTSGFIWRYKDTTPTTPPIQ